MKKLLIFLLLLLGSYSKGQEIIREKLIANFERYYDNGNLQQTGYVSVLNLYDSITCTSRLISVTDSTWKSYDGQGKLLQISNYKEGLKHGAWQYYLEGYTAQVIYVEGIKVRYLEVSDTGKLMYLKDF